MTVCIYKNNKIVTDSRCTYQGDYVISDKFKKVGYIYECLSTGTRSLHPENLVHPTFFAMYCLAGMPEQVPKFLRWFIEQPHPDIDDELNECFNDPILTFDPDDTALQIMVVFKNYDIVRLYSSNYEQHVYIDFKQDDCITIGSGGIAALAIHSYDPSAEPEAIIKSVIDTVNSCGGDVITLEFDSDLYNYNITYAEEKLTFSEKCKNLWKKCTK